MFTGIVEAVGTVVAVRELAEAREVTIREPMMVTELEPGASVSIDGACMTAVRLEEDVFTVDIIGTTLSRTVSGTYRAGSRVNLERAMRIGERLDGHLVQGHVDGVGEVLLVREEGDYRLMDFRIPREVWDGTVLHGSIAINGVSLTVNDLPRPCECQIGIIPYTWENTNFRWLEPGDPVNLEADLIGKYVGRMLVSHGLVGASTGSVGNEGQRE